MIAAVVLLAVMAAPPAENRCTLCHPDVRVQFERSVHRAEQVTCSGCHGGDESAVSVERAHRGNFRGIPARRDIPSLCASCHADPKAMGAYNLPSDQYALYQTSVHGRRLAEGDPRVAVCTDCHGTHEILRSDDPAGPVHARNVPRTCARCHSDAALMARYGARDDPFKDYASGVHGKALLEDGNLGAPDCTRCHGAHGASPPGVGNVDKICGQCHQTTRAHFLEGPHKAAMDAAGLPECASCHSNHATRRADAGWLDTLCLDCHERGSPQAEVGGKMRTLYTRAEEEIETARARVEHAARVPIYVEDYRARLEEAHTSLMESLPVMHALDLARAERFTERARGIAGEVASEVNGKLDNLKWRRVGLLAFWFYLLVTIALLLRFRRRDRTAGAAR